MYPERTVLLVDGDVDSRTVYRAVLQHCGYRVLEAEDGLMAVALAVSDRPDLVVTELTVPKLSGFDLLQRLRTQDATHGMRTIVLSAVAFDEDRQRAYAAGCELFLAKPVEPKELVYEIDKLIG
ncbi:MAG TPA: response regulator [Longimicrobiales bacterium]|nr:response regulator [Longimicrobiales bacterium]